MRTRTSLCDVINVANDAVALWRSYTCAKGAGSLGQNIHRIW